MYEKIDKIDNKIKKRKTIKEIMIEDPLLYYSIFKISEYEEYLIFNIKE